MLIKEFLFGRREFAKEAAPIIPKVPNVLVLMDYENIAIEASQYGKVVDFRKLADLSRSYGEVVESVIFITLSTANGHSAIIEDARNSGFSVNLAPEPPRDPATKLVNRAAVKQKNTADTLMIDQGLRWARLVDTIIIITNDQDFLTLVNRLKDQRKNLVLVHGLKVSAALRQVVELRQPVPLKGR